MESILKVISDVAKLPINYHSKSLINTVTERFNNELVFDPELNQMAYTLRDPVNAGIYPAMNEKKKLRGKAGQIDVKSRCFDACLVIDGSLSYKFNDGTKALIRLHDEDALRTVHLYSEDT